jgi:hypothetical protein
MGRRRPLGPSRWLAIALLTLVTLVGVAAFVWRDDILQATLDPKVPFQTYDPPRAPDYGRAAAWAMAPDGPPQPGDPSADVFFVMPTAFEGGQEWNAPIGDPPADRFFERVVAPNYAGPFYRVGRLFAPRYRQASLYTLMTLREDAREARRFAYGDIAAAFREFRDRRSGGRPFVLVGVEQGGTLAARLLAEEIAPDPALRQRLVAAYLLSTVIPADPTPVPACRRRAEAGCVAAWAAAYEGDLQRPQALKDRSLVWGRDGQLVNLEGRQPLCFNPVLGAVTQAPAPARSHLGAANATGLEWGVRPAFLARKIRTECIGGILRISRPKSQSLKLSGSWGDRQKVPGFNLFYADLEADALARLAAWRALPPPAPPTPQPASLPPGRQSNSSWSTRRAWPLALSRSGSRATIRRASSPAAAIRSRWAKGSAKT